MESATADPEVVAAAAAVVGEGDPELTCSICGKSFPNKRGLAMHGRFHKSAEKQAPPRQHPPADEGTVKGAVDEAVGNLIVIGGYLAMVLPHLGVAIAGVPHPDSVPDESGRVRNPKAPPIVRSRAEMAGGILLDQARKNDQVLRALERFNGLFKGSELVQVVGSVAAAAAVDVGLVDPHQALEIGPFQGESALRPVQFVIGDVVAFIDSQRVEAGIATPNGQPDVPDQDWRDEVAGAAPAHEVERGTVVKGGVEDT